MEKNIYTHPETGSIRKIADKATQINISVNIWWIESPVPTFLQTVAQAIITKKLFMCTQKLVYNTRVYTNLNIYVQSYTYTSIERSEKQEKIKFRENGFLI